MLMFKALQLQQHAHISANISLNASWTSSIRLLQLLNKLYHLITSSNIMCQLDIATSFWLNLPNLSFVWFTSSFSCGLCQFCWGLWLCFFLLKLLWIEWLWTELIDSELNWSNFHLSRKTYIYKSYAYKVEKFPMVTLCFSTFSTVTRLFSKFHE